MSSSKSLSLFYLYSIIFFISGCSSSIYQKFEEPILVENVFEVNDSIIKRDPVKLLIQPSSPSNNIFGYPLGLHIYNLANDESDKNFEEWLNKNPKRIKRLSRLLSRKQITQLKQYNNSFSEFLKNLGQKPTKISDVNVNQNIRRLEQYYKNEGYFDSKVYADTIINENQAKIKYNVTTNTRYQIDSVSININSKDIDSLISSNQKKSLLKKGESFSINKLILERDRLVNLFKNNGIYDFQQRSINYNVLIDSSGVNKKIPIVLSVVNPNKENSYQKKLLSKTNV
mgnify:FL=1